MKAFRHLAALSLAASAGMAAAQEARPLQLGHFSVSLTVKDIRASLAFYEKLGFRQVAGDLAKNWIVLQSGSAKIGLFQGMFPRNTLTFNPGWGPDAAALESFQDVRELQRTLKSRGVPMTVEADEKTRGPGFFVVTDPDGNPLLFDQHVASPRP